MERTVYQREPNGETVLIGEPDQSVGVDLSSSAGNGPFSGSGAVAVAEPRAIHEVVLDPATLERVKQDYLVVAIASSSRACWRSWNCKPGQQERQLRSSLP